VSDPYGGSAYAEDDRLPLLNGQSFRMIRPASAMSLMPKQPPATGFHGSFEFHDMGSYGVGLVTGAMYRLIQVQNESFNTQADQLPTTDTAIFLRRFISQGSINNFRVTDIFHFTIDANGNMTSFRNTSERVCD
jgi:hypothetical protein